MTNRNRLVALVALTIGGTVAHADITTSYTGTLSSPEDTVEIVVTLPMAGVLGLQTYGFGGGTNAAGTLIPAGGFDPFVGVFEGTGDAATFIDGTSDVLTNYGSFMGCPPAGEVNIGGLVCGDVTMPSSLAAGTYTVLLADGAYIPIAVFETNGTLGDGFSDFTGGAFQTCNGSDCATDTANWVLDITTPSVPEPSGILLLGTAVFGSLIVYRRRRIVSSIARYQSTKESNT